MNAAPWSYTIGGQQHIGFLAKPRNTQPRPAILFMHDWGGRSAYFDERAKAVAELGYVGCAMDMYGGGKVAVEKDEKRALMTPLVSDRQRLQQIMLASVEAVAALPEVDAQRIFIMGYCFGGLCALDAARVGAPIRGAISFHGLLHAPPVKQATRIHASILVLHGYDDPLALPATMDDFAEEMSAAKVDWQLHAYGLVKHSFTTPGADDATMGLKYNAKADKRSWQAALNFIEELCE